MGDSLWLEIDAPYVQLKVWPLKLHDGGEAGKHATIDLSQWQMQARIASCVEEMMVLLGFLNVSSINNECGSLDDSQK